mmetsp:Transcript_23784/g.51943  ORF Transcript_23784/g.51943 Transcript_23784/m.51943 type:complete len:203 (-) Transcript_23784:685-1293(-)
MDSDWASRLRSSASTAALRAVSLWTVSCNFSILSPWSLHCCRIMSIFASESRCLSSAAATRLSSCATRSSPAAASWRALASSARTSSSSSWASTSIWSFTSDSRISSAIRCSCSLTLASSARPVDIRLLASRSLSSRWSLCLTWSCWAVDLSWFRLRKVCCATVHAAISPATGASTATKRAPAIAFKVKRRTSTECLRAFAS